MEQKGFAIIDRMFEQLEKEVISKEKQDEIVDNTDELE